MIFSKVNVAVLLIDHADGSPCIVIAYDDYGI